MPWCDPRMDRGVRPCDQSRGGSIRDLGLAWIRWARGPTLARMGDEILPLPSFDSLAAVCLGLYDCLCSEMMIYLVSIWLLVSVSVCAFGYGGQSRQNRDREAKTGYPHLRRRVCLSAVGTDGGLRGTCHAGERDKHPHGSNRTVASDLKSPSLYHAAPPSARLFRFYKSRERISRSPLSGGGGVLT